MLNTPHDQLAAQGYFLSSIQLPPIIRESVLKRNWIALDSAIRREADPGGTIFEELRKIANFSDIEFIISIRSSLSEPDEDGIWHDDGSRLLAFSLSLTVDHAHVEGGLLELRKKGAETPASGFIATPPFETMIVFATGQSGFEHKINKVTRGERIIVAGWCT